MTYSTTGRTGEIAQTVRARYAYALMDLAESDTSPAVKMATDQALRKYAASLKRDSDKGSQWIAARITAFLRRPVSGTKPTAPAKTLPPGSPIGSE